MERQLEASIRKVVAFLDANGYRYAIIGGIALAQWGVVRATYDADIKLLVPDQNYANTRAVLRAAFPQNARPELSSNALIVAANVDDVVVDFLLALPGYEEMIIQHAVLRDLGGWQAWFCSAEDLVIQKAVAGREKDWLDVKELLIEQSGLLNEDYIADWLQQFAEALEKPDLLEQYRRISAEAKAPR